MTIHVRSTIIVGRSDVRTATTQDPFDYRLDMANTMIDAVVRGDATKQPEPVASMVSSLAARPAKRVMGGFVDSDDDDDDDDEDSERNTPVPPAPQVAVSEVDLTALPPSQPAIPLQDAQIDDQALPEENEEDRYGLLFSAGSQPQPTILSARPLSPPPAGASTVVIQTCKGRAIPVRQRTQRYSAPVVVPYQELVAQRSKTKEGRARRSYFGIAIHELVDGAQKEILQAKEKEEKERKQKEAAQAAEAAEAEINQVYMPDGDQHQGKGKSVAVPVSMPAPTPAPARRPKKTLLWTEKYRARNFMDLVGDDLTNRIVLRWLKRWDPMVFPGSKRVAPIKPARPPPSAPMGLNSNNNYNSNNNGYKGADAAEEKPHRKILILTGPPGLGKTTLAHVCARQAGYEVLEINASDDRSRDVVNGRIRTSLGTESVKVNTVASHDKNKTQKTQKIQGRPVCVVVDEVDGVVGGAQSGGGGGEGGFVKALIDLVHLDQKNSGQQVSTAAQPARKRKGDDFRQMRPLILICNDVYHAALRPLRLSGLAEIVHVGKPSVDAVVVRLKSIFEKEGIPCEKEAARKLCEAAWGMSTAGGASRSQKQESGAEGDLRGVMVVGEWVARRLRATAGPTTGPTSIETTPRLTRFWVEKYVLPDLSYGGGTAGSGGGGGLGARGMGRGGVREIVARIFQEGAGFPKASLSSASSADSASRSYRHEQPKEQMSFAEHHQRASMARLREMVETSGDVDRIMTDIFSEYPLREFNDDCYLSKPDAAYEWMHFHDACSRRVFGSQEWELAPYTSQPVLACHQLFASPKRHEPDEDGAGNNNNTGPFAGPRADFSAREAEKMNRLALQTIQSRLPPSLLRAFRNAEDLASDFMPYVVRLVSPDVKPVLVNMANADKNAKGPTSVASVRRDSEKVLVRRAAQVLAELGIKMQRGILEDAAAAVPGRPQWVYRMEPDLDMLSSFETASGLILTGNSAPTRYAVRQVLDQELRRTLAARDNAARQARFQAGTPLGASFAAADMLPDKQPDKHTATSRGAKRKAVEEVAVKRDFFGRVIAEVVTHALQEVDGSGGAGKGDGKGDGKGVGKKRDEEPVWVTYHEGLNNAVRKPISVDEFLRGL